LFSLKITKLVFIRRILFLCQENSDKSEENQELLAEEDVQSIAVQTIISGGGFCGKKQRREKSTADFRKSKKESGKKEKHVSCARNRKR
jgi:hypothetical protein